MNRKRKAESVHGLQLDIDHQFAPRKNKHTPWLNRYYELSNYKSEHGDCLVPRNYKPNPQLGRWVNLQRKDYKLKTEGKKSSMSEFRISLLEELGFAWVGVKTDWENRFVELQKYKAEYGDCLVPQQFQPNRKLGRWVNVQRKDYKLMIEGKSSPMNHERVSMLEGLGFVWSVEKFWYRRLEELKAYQLEHGDCLVPCHYNLNPQLGQWVQVQRRNHRAKKEGGKSPLSKERFELLQQLGFQWNTSEADEKVQNQKLRKVESPSPAATDQKSLELDGVIGLVLFQAKAKNLVRNCNE